MAKKNKWELRFGDPLKKITEPYWDHLDFRRIDDLDDEGFAFLMRGIKGVGMLDLNELMISNESIKLISQLEYVKELRLKGCRLVDNDCAGDLNQVKGLEFLHVKGTGITIDGLLQLDRHRELKTLMFSAEDIIAIHPKMPLLKELMPACEFVINSTPFTFLDRTKY